MIELAFVLCTAYYGGDAIAEGRFDTFPDATAATTEYLREVRELNEGLPGILEVRCVGYGWVR